MAQNQTPTQDEARIALETLMQADPQNTATIRSYLNAIVRKDVAVLGDNQIFTIRDENGRIIKTRSELVLSKENGGLIQPVYNGPWVVSAQGYGMWAEATGTCVMCPEQVQAGNEWMRNPYIVRDPETKRITEVWARAVAFKYSPNGLPQASDRTTIYDVQAYRLLDLIAKAKKKPDVFQLLPSNMEPEGKGRWACFNIDEVLNLWGNTSHDDFVDWISTILNREKKVLDYAQTFAKRNCLKHLSGIQKSPTGDYWSMTVDCWQPENGSMLQWNLSQYEETQKRMSGLSSGKTQALPEADRGHVIDIQSGTDRVEEEPEALNAEVDPEDLATENEIPEPAPEPQTRPESGATEPLSDEDKRVLRQLQATIDQMPEEYEDACRRLNIQAQGVHSPDQAREIMDEVNALLGVNEEA